MILVKFRGIGKGAVAIVAAPVGADQGQALLVPSSRLSPALGELIGDRLAEDAGRRRDRLDPVDIVLRGRQRSRS